MDEIHCIIRKTKNDKIDTLLIAKCIMLSNYTLVTEKDIEIIKLRTLCRFKFDVKKSQMLIEQIQMLQKQIDLLDIDITNIMEKLDSPILSISGIGVFIISEIGNISHFSSATKLLAFAGLNPSVRQSGNFNATNTKISKRGSKHLRYAINYVAQLIIGNDDTFYQYYTTKLAQGKSCLIFIL